MVETNYKQIDFIKIFNVLIKYRKQYVIVMFSVFVLTYLIVMCVPRYYTCVVTLAPESTSGSSAGSLGSVASALGIGASLNKMNTSDALFSDMYPDILKSSGFIAELMTVDVESQDKKIKSKYYTYLRDHQKGAWWNYVLGWVINLFSKQEVETYDGKEKISTFQLTKCQSDIFDLAKSNISCSIDQKTDIVSIQVKDQDPVICAVMANKTCEKLQEFIVDYRTNKTRIDYEYYKKLCAESKERYERARRLYASYADANVDVQLASYKSKQEDLENDMQLKYNMYTAMSTQMQSAAAKLQESTPAFTVIQDATVPIKPAGPKRVLSALFMSLLAFLILSVWIIMKDKNAIFKS